MEEDDEEISVPWIQRRKSKTPEASHYQSLQSHLNSGSSQTLYQSVRNTLCNNVESMSSLNSMHSAIDLLGKYSAAK